MAFLSLSLSVLLSAANPVLAPADMACRFQTGDTETTWISVRPGAETERPGLFRVRMWIAGRPLAGNAIALDKTEARDVVVRGVTRDKTTWLIAVKDNGKAFLQTKAPQKDAEVIAQSGECSHYREAMEVWLPT